MDKYEQHFTIKILDKPNDGTSYIMWNPKEDNEVFVVKGNGWQLTESNDQTISLEEDQMLTVKKGTCYTFFGGDDSLVLQLKSK